ncbi:hypothetical protein Q7P35_005641 [Cladosporium inversicolor]
MEKAYAVHSSNFFGSSPHSLIVRYAGTQYSIRMSPEVLVGTDFHSTYKGLLAEMNERDENGLPKHSILKTIDALQQLVWKTCTPVYEAYGKTEEPFKPETLQEYIQPPTLHIALTKDARSEDGVIAKVIGDSSNSYPWDTSRTAQNNSNITNSYSWDVAPVPAQDLTPDSTVQTFPACELFVTNKPITDGPVQQVHNAAGTQFFFKPRFDLMAPEFDREFSVLGAMSRCGLDGTLKVSPFKGMVLLDNGLVAGMLFEWLEGWPLAEHPAISNLSLHKRWREQVEAIVKDLHRNEIVWGDANVHNIFVDVNADAWVIDFGGNCNVQFVDEELKETYEGDVQGLRRIFEEWLPGMGKP